MKQIVNIKHKQLWVLLMVAMMVVVGVFWAVQPAAASMSLEMKVKAPVQEVDTDGDGETEPFSAAVEVYADGSAEGSMAIGVAHSITLKRGMPRCVAGVETAVLEGTLYEMNDGTPVEVGDVTVHVSPANGGSGGGGGGINFDFDIINTAVQLQNFNAQGTLWFANPPCAS
jgi:hypothetical protein